MTSTTVPVSTGNCVVVSIVLVHSVFSPIHIGAVEVIQCVTLTFMLRLIKSYCKVHNCVAAVRQISI